MYDLTDAIAFPLNSNDLLPDAKVVDEERFGKCAVLKTGETLDFGKPDDVALNIADSTCTVWLRNNEAGSTFNFLNNIGWKFDKNGLLHTAEKECTYTLPDQQWLHITIVKQQNELTVYVNGTLAGKAQPVTWTSDKGYPGGSVVVHEGVIYTAEWYANAGDIPALSESVDAPNAWHGWVEGGGNFEATDKKPDVQFRCDSGEIYLAHQHFYNRALSLAEILQDFYQSLPSAEDAAPEVYPLSATLTNPGEGDWSSFTNNLMIVDSTGNIQQAVEIKNINEESIKLNTLQSVTASSENFHFELRFKNKTFDDQTKHPDFNVSFDSNGQEVEQQFETTEDWNISAPTRNNDDASWSIFFACKKAIEINPKATLNFVFEYSSANKGEGARDTKFAFYYKNMQFSSEKTIQGDTTNAINVFNESSNNSVITGIRDDVNKADAKVGSIEESLSKITTLNTLKNKKQEIQDKLDLIDASSDSEKDKQAAKDLLLSETSRSITERTGVESHQAIELLTEHALALNAEVDLRAEFNNKRFQLLEELYPLNVSYNAPKGTVVDQASSKLVFTVHNHSSKKIVFNDAIIVRLPIAPPAPAAEDRDEKSVLDQIKSLCTSVEKSGEACSLTLPDSSTSNDYHAAAGSFTFNCKDSDEKFSLEANESLIIEIDNIMINSWAGTCFAQVEFQGVKNEGDHSFSLPITKTTRDLANLVGGVSTQSENFAGVGIGTKDKAPQASLDVQGNVAISDTLTVTSDVAISDTLTVTSDVVIPGSGEFKGHGIVPIGTVIDWWRPNADTKLPPGWAIADGRTLNSNHEVAYSPAFDGKVLPDLIDKFVRGASENNVKDKGGYTTGGADTHKHYSDYKTDTAGSHNHNWCWFSGKKMSTYNSSGSRWSVINWGDGTGTEGSGYYGLLGGKPFDGYTDKHNGHQHTTNGWTHERSSIPAYVGLLKLIRVL
ncbi:carbohydrate binding protein [Sinobacterium caligoides]|uniref:Carbohydrate binding protein n=1 Tax=Sinobacterium caligoides TaxID=933926 RepID=A0A3N2DLC7_9GAMM|nr:hypothetical protein [Sinobacterium caligoides]ROS00165.1 carbohydrate binding protein [Sinobacterium caligoides]